MANKLFLVSATLAFFFLLTNASIYRTIVEFEEDDHATNHWPIRQPGLKQKCQKEFQQEQHLRACQQWIHQQAMQSGGGSSWALNDEFDILNTQGSQHRHPVLQKCCAELHAEDQVCVCPTLEGAAKALRYQVKQHERQQEQSQQMISRIFETAKNLPQICKVQQVGVCPFSDKPSLPPTYY